MSKEKNSARRNLVYELNGRPPLAAAVPLGLQHVLSMFIGNLAPVVVLTSVVSAVTGEAIATPEQKMIMIQCCMFASGVTTLLQLYPIKIGPYQIGAGLPIVMGTSFAFVPTMTTLGAEFGLNVVLGAVIVGGVVEIIMGFFIKPLKRFFPPLVIGAVLMTIGLHLLPVGVQYFAGGAAAEGAARAAAAGGPLNAWQEMMAAKYASWQNLLIGTTVFLTIMALQRFARGMLKVSAILVGILVGYVLAIVLGEVDFQQVRDAGIISPPIPFFIRPEFRLDAILSIAALYVVSGLETMGNINGITIAAFDKEATSRQMSGAVMADAAGSMFAGMFNCLPNTAFGQNAGIVAMTKVVNKFCIFTGALILILAGLSPKIGAIFSVMPPSVLGGAVVTVFAMIMLNGMKLIAKAGFSDRNLLILAITFGVAYAIGENKTLVLHLPSSIQFLFKDTTVTVCVFSILLNVVFPPSAEEKERLRKAQEEAALEELKQ
jgi:NCS2 family nucleobase:cation symporter-2